MCGVPPEKFLEVCEAWTANSGRERTTALVYSVGWTHHTVGAQYIRTAAIVQLHRAYAGAVASADDYAQRLQADPLFAELLHRILSGITAVRSGAEILEDVPDLDEAPEKTAATRNGSPSPSE